MDAVYILGTGSLANNEEILYSIRSLDRYAIGLRDVYVVGEYPEGLGGIIHVPCEDITDEKWKNAYHKVLVACDLNQISDEFLLMNDDFFLLEPIDIENFPFYALKGATGGTCGAVNFQVHCPIRINKQWYLNMPTLSEQKACKSPRTFYANFYKAPPTYSEDPILRIKEKDNDFYEQTQQKKFFSVSNGAFLHKGFTDWIKERYSVSSRFEI